jgi:hypothetical protein
MLPRSSFQGILRHLEIVDNQTMGVHAMRAAILVLWGTLAVMLPGPALGAASPDSVVISPTPMAPAPGLTTPRVGGYFQAREVAQEHVGLTAFLNRARLSVDGTLPARFGYRALV